MWDTSLRYLAVFVHGFEASVASLAEPLEGGPLAAAGGAPALDVRQRRHQHGDVVDHLVTTHRLPTLERLLRQRGRGLLGGVARGYDGHRLFVGDKLPDAVGGYDDEPVVLDDLVRPNLRLRGDADPVRDGISQTSGHGQTGHPQVLHPHPERPLPEFTHARRVDAAAEGTLGVRCGHQPRDAPVHGLDPPPLRGQLRLVVACERERLYPSLLHLAAEHRPRVAHPRARDEAPVDVQRHGGGAAVLHVQPVHAVQFHVDAAKRRLEGPPGVLHERRARVFVRDEPGGKSLFHVPRHEVADRSVAVEDPEESAPGGGEPVRKGAVRVLVHARFVRIALRRPYHAPPGDGHATDRDVQRGHALVVDLPHELLRAGLSRELHLDDPLLHVPPGRRLQGRRATGHGAPRMLERALLQQHRRLRICGGAKQKGWGENKKKAAGG